ncbi:hypothetical protein [Tardiphaga sp. 862_B3_N1_1]|uniref:hypothetical protein n=1 Tax=Tardiphaga sp. 862_B3_N1_1 TaxID=3240763 RepID=UPI003F8B6312
MKINLSQGSRITINGVEYSGRNVTITNGRVTVDGKEQEPALQRGPITIAVAGNVETLDLVSGKVEISGNAGTVSSASGDIQCGNVAGNAETLSGDIHCHAIGNNATSMSGNIIMKG